MRTIKQTGQFKRDLRRESKGRYRATLEADLMPVLISLANDSPLESWNKDHLLTKTGRVTVIVILSLIWY
ncbi:type II toxin-antitoxin system YafQ family toxin [Candidatus Fukatsuia symbiotica]|uniref:type II toxin-antitoxin system YafQ family toxin n=1 Tax=Candidatus Fukatsuia TaxID=1927833 RepID=UPI000E6D17CE